MIGPAAGQGCQVQKPSATGLMWTASSIIWSWSCSNCKLIQKMVMITTLVLIVTDDSWCHWGATWSLYPPLKTVAKSAAICRLVCQRDPVWDLPCIICLICCASVCIPPFKSGPDVHVYIKKHSCWFFADAQTHGSTKLVLYFAVMGYCLISRTEKLMVSTRYIIQLLWQNHDSIQTVFLRVIKRHMSSFLNYSVSKGLITSIV